jgi:hypothetical protein
VGITSRAYLGANNLGFAIPSVIAKRVVAGLVQRRLDHPQLHRDRPQGPAGPRGVLRPGPQHGMLIDSVDPARRPPAPACRPATSSSRSTAGRSTGASPSSCPDPEHDRQPAGRLDPRPHYKRGAARTTTLVTDEAREPDGRGVGLRHLGIGVRKVSRAFARRTSSRRHRRPRDRRPAGLSGRRRRPGPRRHHHEDQPEPGGSLDVIRPPTRPTPKPGPTLFEVQRDRRSPSWSSSHEVAAPISSPPPASSSAAGAPGPRTSRPLGGARQVHRRRRVRDRERARAPPDVAYGVVDDRNGHDHPALGGDRPARLPEAAQGLQGLPAGRSGGHPGVYLGRDAYTGWHFVRAERLGPRRLVPVTAFAGRALPRARPGRRGLGHRAAQQGRGLHAVHPPEPRRLIQRCRSGPAIAQQEVAGPGLPVFNRDGVFVGLGASSFGQTFLEFSGWTAAGPPVMLVNLEESSAFLVADEVLPYLGRIPKNVFGRPLAWLGAYGLEPMDRDVADFLKLQSQSGAVVSEVLEGSPAEKAGMKAHDIILGIDGKPLPRFRPDRVVVDYVERLIERRRPGRHHDALGPARHPTGSSCGPRSATSRAGPRGRPDVFRAHRLHRARVRLRRRDRAAFSQPVWRRRRAPT